MFWEKEENGPDDRSKEFLEKAVVTLAAGNSIEFAEGV